MDKYRRLRDSGRRSIQTDRLDEVLRRYPCRISEYPKTEGIQDAGFLQGYSSHSTLEARARERILNKNLSDASKELQGRTNEWQGMNPLEHNMYRRMLIVPGQ